MATLTLKNIPDDLYSTLKEKARTHHRSINSEVIVCLEKTLYSRKRDLKSILEIAKLTRERTAKAYLTQDELRKMINEGRE